LTIHSQSGKPDVTGAPRGQHYIILPIDDPRNNPSFRSRHPNVKFEGYSKKKVPKASDLHPVEKHNPTTKTKSKPPSVTLPTHAAPGAAPLGLGDPISATLDSDLETSEDDNFVMGEVEAEHNDTTHDSATEPNTGGDVVKLSEGIQQNYLENSITPPTNLSINNLTLISETDSGDGIPTYVASLEFDVEDASNQYEIRIAKVS